MKIAVIGADGCIGTRAIESFQLDEGPSVAAITGHSFHLSRAARFSIDLRVADVLDIASLAHSLAGCSAAVHAMPVNPADQKRSASVFCRAAAQAGVRRLVYLSSTDVHGVNPPAGTDEKSPLRADLVHESINSLVTAERQFLSETRHLGLIGVVLRPAAIYGPRSNFIAQIATELLQNRAGPYSKGDGICNCVYVDNVVTAIRLSLKAKIAGGSIFIITDEETVTWRALYQTVARELELPAGASTYLNAQPEDADVAAMAARTLAATDNLPPAPHDLPPQGDAMDRYRCMWKFPTTRAKQDLGLQAPVSFAEGMRRTAAWWRFAHGDFSSVA